MKRALLIAALALVLLPATATGQSATPECSPAPANCSGWYATDVSLTWTISASYSKACDNFRFTRDGVQQRTCLVSADNENWIPIPVTVRVDKTAPRVSGAAPSRGPDANGWYRSPVNVAFFGTDVVAGVDSSGVAACETRTYGGPDADPGQIAGRCWDRAGNVSAATLYGLRYDSTPPSLASVRAETGDRIVRLRWAIPDAADLKVWRSPGRGDAAESRMEPDPGGLNDRRVRNGRRYDYRIRAVDEAGNAATIVVSVVPGPHLIAPAHRERVVEPPLLRWTKVRHARYYNVQLFRRGRKILSAWPSRPRLQLEQAWRFGGARRTLAPGRYRWMVWPGRGPRAENEYGRLIGRRTFIVK